MKNKCIIIVFMLAFFINAVAQHKVVKRTSTQNKGAYAIKKSDDPLDYYYKIENLRGWKTDLHFWYISAIIISKKCTILHKWCKPDVPNTCVYSNENEFIEDAQSKQRYYIEESDIGIGYDNHWVVKDTKHFMFAEWYPPLPSSVKVINIHSGSRYIVKQLRIIRK
ncbi:hypothetical protein [Prevotella sp.]|uniref:hypothetical protein n=1 Tax=Prevotella sp. TaxID=59823 RepID=UPI0027E33396|nr:hypothetical protein [Prevotella sp.]